MGGGGKSRRRRRRRRRKDGVGVDNDLQQRICNSVVAVHTRVMQRYVANVVAV